MTSRLHRFSTSISKLNFKSLLIVVVLLLIGIVALCRITTKPKVSASATWWNDGWAYRQRIDITNSSNSNLTNFQVSFSIGTSALVNSGHMKSTCADIRLTDQYGTLLPYWIEENNPGCNKPGNTIIWTKLPSLPKDGAPIYLYYGNVTAASTQSNGSDIFEFIDTFNSGFDATKWITESTAPVFSGGTVSFTAKQGMYNNVQRQYYNIRFRNLIANATDNTWYGWNTTSGLGGLGTAGAVRPMMNGLNFSGAGIECIENIGFGATPPGDNAWHTNEIRWDSTSQKMYYYTDNLLQGSTSSCAKTNNRLIELFHWAGAATDYMDWIIVTKSASTYPTSSLTASEEVGGGPIGYWKFDEGVGSSAYDSSPNKLNGLVTGTKWTASDQCLSGSCIYFPGNNNNVTIPNSTALQITGDLTLQAWVRFQGTARGDIFYKDFNREYDTTLDTNGSLTFYHGDGAWEGMTNNLNVPLNQWVFLTVVRDTTAKRIYYYLNGQYKGFAGYARTPITGTSNLLIGSRGGNGNPFAGYIDEAKIFNYQRSASLVAADYQAGLSGQSSTHGNSVNIGSPSSKSLTDGLVGYYKFDEGTGTSVLDSSGRNNTGNFGAGSSAPTWNLGKFSVGLSFDGVSDYVSGTGATLFFPAGAPRTVAAWVKNVATSGRSEILNTSSNYFNIQSNKVCYYITGANSSYVCSTSSLPANQWNLVVATYENNTEKIYINGVFDIGSTVNTSNAAGDNGTIGICSYCGGGNAFNGLMDEVRLYNKALSASDIQTLYNYAPPPLAYFNFDDASGTIAKDTSGSGYTGTFSGATGNQWTSGKNGSALYFNGTNTNLDLATASTFKLYGQLTFSAWIKATTDSPDYSGIITSRDVGGTITGLGINNASVLRFDFHGPTAAASLTGTRNLRDNNWHYVAGTYDGTTMRLYIDGNPDGSAVQTLGNLDAADIFRIGWDDVDSLRHFKGKIDDVRIYNYARTPAQIVADMNSGNPMSASKTPALYYKFDEGFGTTTKNSFSSLYPANFGVSTSAPVWTADARSGKALSFTAANSQYMTINDNANSPTDIGQPGLTISAWIKPNTLTSTHAIVNKNSPYLLWIDGANKRLYTGLYNGASWYWTWSAINSLQTGVWQHVAMTYDGTTRYTYVNGVQSGPADTQISGNISSTDTTIQIGRDASGGGRYYFDGLIDEVKIYSYALSSDDIKKDYNQSSALVAGQSTQTIGATTTSLEYCLPGDTTACTPPIAEWTFNDGTGSTAYDSSGNNNHATLGPGNSAPVWASGKSGSGLYFDGSKDYLDAGTSVGDFTNNFSVSAWVKTTSKNNRILARRENTNGVQYDLYLDNTSGRASLYDGNTQFYGTSTLTDNKWHFISWVVNGANSKIYVDGANETTFSPTIVSRSVTTTIGAWNKPSPTGFWNGSIDQIRIYNYARTPAQVAYDFNKGAPVGWWKFDECQGSTIYEASVGTTGSISVGPSGSQINLGTCSLGTSAAWTNGAQGKYNSSLNFDGVDDYVNAGTPAALNTSGDNTQAAWIKVPSLPAATTAIVRWNNITNISLRLTPAGKLDHNYYGTSWRTVTDTGSLAVTPNQWVHVAIVRSNTNNTLSFYYNGKLSSTVALPELPTSSPTGYITIGGITGSAQQFYGQIDDVRVYNYALTSTQMKTLYNNGALNFGPASGSP